MNSTMKINDGLQNGLKMIHSIGKAMNYGCKCTGEIIEGVSALPAEGHKMLTNLVTKQEVPDIDDLSLKKTAEASKENEDSEPKDIKDEDVIDPLMA